jgi:hypothetical protein
MQGTPTESATSLTARLGSGNTVPATISMVVGNDGWGNMLAHASQQRSGLALATRLTTAIGSTTMAGDMRRLLADGVASFGRLYQVTVAAMRALEQAGAARTSRDEAVRNALVLSNDLPTVIISGRAHVILDKEGGDVTALAIVDYKTSTEDDPSANEQHDLQFGVYTDSGRREGLDVRAVCVHDLKTLTGGESMSHRAPSPRPRPSLRPQPTRRSREPRLPGPSRPCPQAMRPEETVPPGCYIQASAPLYESQTRARKGR